MFYIEHDSDNFTIIDCCIDDNTSDRIINEIKPKCDSKGIVRFISSHPDQDHIRGIEKLFNEIDIPNFYCIKNSTSKEEETTDFIKYKELRNNDKVFYISKGCSRKWMNQADNERGSSGINVLWPDTKNKHFKDALKSAEDGNSPNNISPIIKYSLECGADIAWMGDLETEFMEEIKTDISLPKINILFAPHHGRDSGKVPKKLLDEMNPDIIVIGEAPSKYLNYYADYNTITQNSAGNITFDCGVSQVHIYTSSSTYTVDFLSNHDKPNKYKSFYLGTLIL